MPVKERDITSSLPNELDVEGMAARGLVGKIRIVGVHWDGRREELQAVFWVNLGMHRVRHYRLDADGKFFVDPLTGDVARKERVFEDVRIIMKEGSQ